MTNLRDRVFARAEILRPDGQSVPPSAAQVTARLRRLRDLLARLDSGKDVARRDLRNVLTEEEWATHESVAGMARSDALGPRPVELDRYIELLRKADFFDARADSTKVTSRSTIDHLSRPGRKRLRADAETTYERALEYLYEQLDSAQGQLIRQWLDRPVNTQLGYEPSLDRERMPRVKGSRSVHVEQGGGGSIFDQKRGNKRAALADAIKALERDAG